MVAERGAKDDEKEDDEVDIDEDKKAAKDEAEDAVPDVGHRPIVFVRLETVVEESFDAK